MDSLLTDHRSDLGLVSPDVPLISNLPVWRNIALIRQYHENLPSAQAIELVVGLLKRFSLAGISHRRSSALKMEELFLTMLIRAAMVRNAIIVLDRPFRLVPHRPDDRFLMDSLRKLDDLIAEVYFFDYDWEKDHYGVTNGAAD